MSQAILENKRIAVTGACGTVGSELVNQLLNNYKIEELIALDNNESELFFLEQRFKDHTNARFLLCDVRDVNKLEKSFKNVDIVFHAAAYKHVILCERSPFEAVQTNIIGVQNIINATSKNNVQRVIFTSSDKAVNSTNVMGTSKLMGERLMTAANNNCRGEGTIFSSTRFGNVLGSRGSVIPIFKNQIKQGGPITVTDKEMTRFIMSIKQSVSLVIDSVEQAKGGEIFVTKMPVINIYDLAQVLIKKLAPRYDINPDTIDIEIIGAKPGEKLYEELLSHEETRRTLELDKYFVITPAFKNVYRNIEYTYDTLISTNVDRAYCSHEEQKLTQEETEQFLILNDLI